MDVFLLFSWALTSPMQGQISIQKITLTLQVFKQPQLKAKRDMESSFTHLQIIKVLSLNSANKIFRLFTMIYSFLALSGVPDQVESWKKVEQSHCGRVWPLLCLCLHFQSAEDRGPATGVFVAQVDQLVTFPQVKAWQLAMLLCILDRNGSLKTKYGRKCVASLFFFSFCFSTPCQALVKFLPDEPDNP